MYSPFQYIIILEQKKSSLQFFLLIPNYLKNTQGHHILAFGIDTRNLLQSQQEKNDLKFFLNIAPLLSSHLNPISVFSSTEKLFCYVLFFI